MAAYVQRAIMILQQVTQIGHQVDQIKQFQAKLDKIREQVTMVKDVKDSALGVIGGFKQDFDYPVFGAGRLGGRFHGRLGK